MEMSTFIQWDYKLEKTFGIAQDGVRLHHHNTTIMADKLASERFAMPILVMCTSNNRNREHGRKAGDKFNLLRSFFNYAGTQPTSHVKTEDGQ